MLDSLKLDKLELITRAKITEQGLLIPKHLLADTAEVEIRQAYNVLLIVPIVDEDPILHLGTQPIIEDVSDASINHDKYLYRP